MARKKKDDSKIDIQFLRTVTPAKGTTGKIRRETAFACKLKARLNFPRSAKQTSSSEAA